MHPIFHQSNIPGTSWNYQGNQQPQMPPTPGTTIGWMPGRIPGSHQHAQQFFPPHVMPGTSYGIQNPSPVSGYQHNVSGNFSPQQPWSGICNKSIQTSSQIKLYGAPSAREFRWDGNRDTFITYKKRFEAACKQHGVGYLVAPAFIQAYFADPNYIFINECSQACGYSGSQVQHDIQWFHGTMSNTMTNLDIPQLSGTTDGVIAWNNLCHAYGHQGQLYRNTMYYQELESEFRQKFQPKRMNIMGYNKRFLCNAARLAEYDPCTFTRKKILEIYMGSALWLMGSGLLTPFNPLYVDALKSYSDVIDGFIDHTEHCIANAHMTHLNTKLINNMQQQANSVPDPNYVLAGDHPSNATSCDDVMTLKSLVSEFNKVGFGYLKHNQDPKLEEANALSLAKIYFTRKAANNDMTVPSRLWKALEPSIQKASILFAKSFVMKRKTLENENNHICQPRIHPMMVTRLLASNTLNLP